VSASAKEQKYRERQRQVIDAAAAVFAEKGYHGASTKEIAERLGIRQGSLYYYFSSKEEALAEVCRLGVEGHVQRLESIIATDIPAREKIRRFFLCHLEPLRTLPNHMEVFLGQRQHLGGQRRRNVQRIARTYEELVVEIFRQGVAGGEFPADLDCRLAALGLLGMCNWVPTWYARNRSHTLEEIAEQFAAIFLEGLKA
jgi:AcrR family transcriptional regulator